MTLLREPPAPHLHISVFMRPFWKSAGLNAVITSTRIHARGRCTFFVRSSAPVGQLPESRAEPGTSRSCAQGRGFWRQWPRHRILINGTRRLSILELSAFNMMMACKEARSQMPSMPEALSLEWKWQQLRPMPPLQSMGSEQQAHKWSAQTVQQ